MSKVAELRELPDDQLIERLESNKEEIFNLRFQLATGQLDNPMRIKAVRHDVARILTVLRERHVEQSFQEELARADTEALAESRQAQAKGRKRGKPLDELMQAAEEPEGEEAP
jgi:large subunit ribosomal protein L29